MAALSPSGLSRASRRDARVKRVHIVQGGNTTLCNRPKTEGDIVATLYSYIGHRPPSNTCKMCLKIWHR